MRSFNLVGGVLGAVMLAGPALAQQPTIEELMRKIDALQRRVDELESRQQATKPPAAQPHRSGTAAAAAAKATPPAASPAPAPPAVAAVPPATAVAKTEPTTTPFDPNIPGLLPPEPMGNQFENEDALRSDLPGLAIRIPGTDSQLRVYGFAKLSAWTDLNGRNQTDAPTAQTIPLNNSAADMQGGDFGMTARFSRIGMDSVH